MFARRAEMMRQTPPRSVKTTTNSLPSISPTAFCRAWGSLMAGVELDLARVQEDTGGLAEGNAMLGEIGSRLRVVPFEFTPPRHERIYGISV